MDQDDADLSGGAVVVLPDLGASNTGTPHLITFGASRATNTWWTAIACQGV